MLWWTKKKNRLNDEDDFDEATEETIDLVFYVTFMCVYIDNFIMEISIFYLFEWCSCHQIEQIVYVRVRNTRMKNL